MIGEFRGKYFFLSNFYEVPVTYDGITYQNNEAAFQAQKVFGEARRQFEGISPKEAKRLGRRVSLRSDWEYVKEDKMREIVRAKFVQNPDLMKKLLDTGNEELIEGNNWGDRTWGMVGGTGQNLLGKILMDLRDEERRDRTTDYHDEFPLGEKQHSPLHCELFSLKEALDACQGTQEVELEEIGK